MSRRREITGFDMDRFSAPRVVARFSVLVEGKRPWDGGAEKEAREKGGPCPKCGGVELRWSWCCIACGNAGPDKAVAEGRAEYPGLGKDELPDEGYIEEYGLRARKYKGGKLKGGRG